MIVNGSRAGSYQKSDRLVNRDVGPTRMADDLNGERNRALSMTIIW